MAYAQDPRREHIVVTLFKAVFVSIPMVLAGFVVGLSASIRSRTIYRILVVLAVLIYVAFYATVLWAPDLFRAVIHFHAWSDPPRKAVAVPLVSYGFYLILSFPIFLILSHLGARWGSPLEKAGSRYRRLTAAWMKRHRKASVTRRIFLGGSLKSGKPIYLTDDMRVMHTQVVGSTGSGKTESVLLPMLAHDIRSGKGAVILDGKGDLDLRDKIWWIVTQNHREKDFSFFSLSYPQLSDTYNPLLRGNATEIKDKLIGSTVWSEEFYKKKAEEALLKLLRPMVAQRTHVRFSTLYSYLVNKDELGKFGDTVLDPEMRSDIAEMVENFGFSQKFLAGIIADLALIARSEFSELVDVESPEIDLLKAYEENRIVYFQLNVQGYEETARRFGRLILQDIKTVSNKIQAEFGARKRHFFGVFIDEFGSFVHENFIEFLNKARGAGFALTMLHQSLGDLVPQGRRSFGFQQQLIENTNLKIVLRQDDPLSVERFAKIAGTKPTLISTYQTAERLFGKGLTGVGSLREGQAFHVEPDLIRTLKKGEAVFIRKHPSFHVDYLKLDFFGHPGLIPEFRKKVRVKKVIPTAVTNEPASKKTQPKKEDKGEGQTKSSAIPLARRIRPIPDTRKIPTVLGDRKTLNHWAEHIRHKKLMP